MSNDGGAKHNLEDSSSTRAPPCHTERPRLKSSAVLVRTDRPADAYGSTTDRTTGHWCWRNFGLGIPHPVPSLVPLSCCLHPPLRPLLLPLPLRPQCVAVSGKSTHLGCVCIWSPRWVKNPIFSGVPSLKCNSQQQGTVAIGLVNFCTNYFQFPNACVWAYLV